jgi:[amino group carrier protein]-L-2-aminoadipate 6-kinase
MNTINVLKLGGGADVDVASVLRNLAARVANGERWILVHGTSDAANTLAERLGTPAQTITTAGGHVSRYTDATQIEIYSMAAASVNQQIVAQLCAQGINAVGLVGAVSAQRHTAIRAIRNGRQVVIRDDYSGTITGVDADLIRTLLDAGRLPVIAPLAFGTGADSSCERLNVDGDLVAAHVARALGADTLIILSNVPGLLRDVSDRASLIPSFALNELSRYESFAAGRMKKKLMAAEQAAAGRTILADSRLEAPIDAALAGMGTHITAESVYVR